MSKPWQWLKRSVKTVEFWLTFLAYAIPLAFLLYVLYINYLPFGYDKTFTIQVGAQGDTDASQPFYLEPSADLSDRQVDASGTPYRTLNGLAKVVFNPGVVLKNANVTVSVEGGDIDPTSQGSDGVQIIPPHIDFDPNSVIWDYSWNFSTSTPADLIGNAFNSDGCEYFDGNSSLQLPNSYDLFESGPFTVYVEWKPELINNDGGGEIIGHYNWELTQFADAIQFQIGRMNSPVGKKYTIEAPITSDFFNTKHSFLAVYNPSDNGFMELLIDGNWIERIYFGSDKIYTNYGTSKELTFGKKPGSPPYYQGCLNKINISSSNLVIYKSTQNFPYTGFDPFHISIVSNATSSLKSILLNVK